MRSLSGILQIRLPAALVSSAALLPFPDSRVRWPSELSSVVTSLSGTCQNFLFVFEVLTFHYNMSRGGIFFFKYVLISAL